MSIILVDPRTDSKYTYLYINSSNTKVYTPRGPNLLQLDEYFDTLFNTCVLFNNELSDVDKLNNYSITIYDTINNIINKQLKPCSENTRINKCDCISISNCMDSDVCAYTLEIQSLMSEYITILSKIVIPEIKANYNFLPTMIQNYTAAAVTIPINKILGTANNYTLCGITLYQTSTVTDSTILSKYTSLLASKNKQLDNVKTQVQAVQTANTIKNIIIGLIICIVVAVIIYFSWKPVSNIIKNITKKASIKKVIN